MYRHLSGIGQMHEPEGRGAPRLSDGRCVTRAPECPTAQPCRIQQGTQSRLQSFGVAAPAALGGVAGGASVTRRIRTGSVAGRSQKKRDGWRSAGTAEAEKIALIRWTAGDAVRGTHA